MEAIKEIEANPVNWLVRYTKLAAVCIGVEALNDGFIKPGIADFVPNALKDWMTTIEEGATLALTLTIVIVIFIIFLF